MKKFIQFCLAALVLVAFAACEKKQEVDPRDAFVGAYTYDAKGSVDFDFGITRYSVPLNNQGTFTISKSGDGNKVVIEGWNDGWEGDWLENGVSNKFMEPTPDFDMQIVADYGHANGVELIGHHETVGFIDNYEQQLEEAYRYLKRYGIRYVKSGYAGSKMTINGRREYHHSQLGVLHYQRALELAAKYNIMLDVHEPIKSTGIERTWQAIDKAKVVLWIVDVTSADTSMAHDILSHCEGKALIAVLNKTDLDDDVAARSELNDILPEGTPIMAISAKSDSDIEALRELIVRSAALPTVDNDAIIVTNARHYQALTRARDAIARAITGLTNGLSGDLLDQDIRECLHWLGEITGEITTDNILGEIFSHFCIGK